MRGFVIPGLAFLVVLSLVVAVHASSWSIASINLDTTRAVVTYNITNGTLREEVTFINYTALVLQSIEYNLRHYIPLNKTQLFYLALLQALSAQGSNAPGIASVSVVSTGPQPMGPYESYEVFLINATLTGTAQTLTIYSLPAFWLANGTEYEYPLYLVALPGTDFAYGYIVFEETASTCYDTFYFYEYFPYYTIFPIPPLMGTIGYYTTPLCTNTITYVSQSMIFFVNGKGYTIAFEPYQGTSMTYPQYPSTINMTVAVQPGSIGIYDIPISTPLALCNTWGLVLGTSCYYLAPTVYPPTQAIQPMPLSLVVYENMPLIVMYPTQPGSYLMWNMYVMPPGGPVPVIKYVLIQASVSGPSVLPKQLFSVSVPYGSCGYADISPSPLQLSGFANYGFLAMVTGYYYTSTAYVGFLGWASGYNTNAPGFNTAVLAVCDFRGFWSLTPTTINVTLSDEYGYPVGYGLVTLEPNYYAWLVIGVIIVLVIAIVATVGSVYGWIGAEKEKGEVVVRL